MWSRGLDSNQRTPVNETGEVNPSSTPNYAGTLFVQVTGIQSLYALVHSARELSRGFGIIPLV